MDNDKSNDDSHRRGFLTSVSGLAMAGGLAAGYGTFADIAVRFLFPAGESLAWMFVSDLDSFAPGSSRAFESPTGIKVVITRKEAGPASEEEAEDAKAAATAAPPSPENGKDAEGEGDDAFTLEASEEKPAIVDQFLALSSTCPHLGCRVHWEPQNDRFFCPCHNGTFDPQGNPTGGPPQAANQALPRYELMVEGGLLFIAMPVETVGSPQPGDEMAQSSLPRDTRTETTPDGQGSQLV